MPMAASGFLKSPYLSSDLPGEDPARPGAGQHVEQPDERLLQPEADRVAVDDLHPLHGIERVAVGIALLAEEAVEGELDVLGRQLAPVDGGHVLPAHPLAQVEHVRQLVRLLPALGQVGLDGVDAGRHPGPDLVAHELVVDEAQRVALLEVEGEMGIEVRRIVAPHAEDAPALALRGEPARRGQRLGRQRRPRGQGSAQQVSPRQPARELREGSVHEPPPRVGLGWFPPRAHPSSHSAAARLP